MTRALGPISGHMTGEDGIVGAKLTAIEALLSGTTTLGEYASEVAELVDQAYRPLRNQGRRHREDKCGPRRSLRYRAGRGVPVRP